MGSPSGEEPTHTPNLDNLARTGTLFTDFHVANPVCSPSRCGFMTGRSPARFRIHTALSGDPAANAQEGCVCVCACVCGFDHLPVVGPLAVGSLKVCIVSVFLTAP